MFYFLDTFLIGSIVYLSNAKSRLLSTCSLNSLLMFNPIFDIYPTWNWNFPLFMHYHIFSHMPNLKIMVCTQQIPQWNWFTIVTFFKCTNFNILFFCFNIILSKHSIFFNVRWIILFWKHNWVFDYCLFLFLIFSFCF